jgi:Uroporphyrinogen decarboxylase (URO-D)
VKKPVFDYNKSDSQGTTLLPLESHRFELKAYSDYETELNEGCQQFWKSDSGVAVYRRFRVPEVFSWGCSDMKMSLEWQLSALEKSKSFRADIPNFLEPWYGIGVVSSAFGIPYIWNEGQAPAVDPPFKKASVALGSIKYSIAESPVGKHILEMIEYFLDKTKGQIPISISDTQSPLNIVSSYIMDLASFSFDMYDNPEDLTKLMDAIVTLESDFIKKQEELIGDALARPGHGFASSRVFDGLGFSDDNMLFLNDDAYNEFAVDPLCRAGRSSGAPVFHSCGNWSGRTELVTGIPGLIMADGAVGAETDPDPNIPEKLGEAFAGTGITLHTRIVGDADTVCENVEKMWRPGLKLIVATYCDSPEEQGKAYRGIHQICKN